MAKVTVNLWAGLRRLTDGAEVVEVEASTIGEMLDALVEAYPGLGPVFDAGVSVAVDGEIINGGRGKPLSPENEIFLLQRMKGG
ncbi:MoaD/ThiS family protein [Albimonas sp. CAU 1670]|uniref:MoaD/ThiS family protein n=1 Tax=Albimonas sp. CAU 1670 TaxID=3032599 RepID=UPI0023D9B817|nr:MoaD/ThiS family protein [Albimonas sp. CAU 1670]MDF2235129.1 MoaD/ThiS family protein [Albimonas sp. CAU 1670]